MTVTRPEWVGPWTAADERLVAAARRDLVDGRRFEELFCAADEPRRKRNRGDRELAALLAAWTGADVAWVLRLLWWSQRPRRKWLREPDYLTRIIGKAVAGCSEFRGEAAARAEAERARRPCVSPHPVLMERLPRRTVHVLWFRCDQWSGCPGCRACLEEKAIANLKERLGRAPALHEFTCTDREWTARRRALARAGVAAGEAAEYIRIRDDDGRNWVVSNVRPAGALPVSPGEAIDHGSGLIRGHRGEKRPVFTSHGWKPSRGPRQPQQWRRVGRAPANIEQHLDAIAAAHGCNAEPYVQPDTPPARRRVMFGRKIVPADGRVLDPDARERLEKDILSNVDGWSYYGLDIDRRRPAHADQDCVVNAFAHAGDPATG
jgi:hypothetical protein